MEDRRRTLAAMALIMGFLTLVAIGVGVMVTSSKVLSPMPEESAIKILFITPTPSLPHTSPTQ